MEEKKSSAIDNLLEIDLSQLPEEIAINLDHLKDAVLHNAPRQWHRCSLYNDLPRVQRAREELRRRAIEEKKVALRQRQEQREAARRKRKLQQEAAKREADIKKNVTSMRQKYSYELDCLEGMNTSQGLLARDKELMARPGYAIATQWIKSKLSDPEGFVPSLFPLVNIFIEGDWIFEAHRYIWQSYILFGIIFEKQKGYSLQVNDALKQLEQRYGILPWVATLDKLKREQKAQGKDRSQWYADKGAWFLEFHENRAIISPYRVVIAYLDKLALHQFGVLVRQDQKPRFTIQCSSLDAFQEYQNSLKQKETLRSQRIKEYQKQQEQTAQEEKARRQLKWSPEFGPDVKL